MTKNNLFLNMRKINILITSVFAFAVIMIAGSGESFAMDSISLGRNTTINISSRNATSLDDRIFKMTRETTFPGWRSDVSVNNSVHNYSYFNSRTSYNDYSEAEYYSDYNDYDYNDEGYYDEYYEDYANNDYYEEDYYVNNSNNNNNNNYSGSNSW